MTTKLSRSKRKPRKHTSYMPSPKSLANLIPYKKGENGHQFGGFNLTERLKHALRKHPEQVEQIICSTIEGCILREPTPFHEVWDRMEGKVPDRTIPGSPELIQNFIFILPDGTKLAPKALIEERNGNRD